jgi:hypothetical protein
MAVCAGATCCLRWSNFNSWREKAKTDPTAAIVQRYHERPAEELYDLHADPLELINLAAEPEQAERLASLRAEVETWMEARGDTGNLWRAAVAHRSRTRPAVRARRGSRGEEKAMSATNPREHGRSLTGFIVMTPILLLAGLVLAFAAVSVTTRSLREKIRYRQPLNKRLSTLTY